MYDARTLSGWQHMRLSLNCRLAGLVCLAVLITACGGGTASPASPSGVASPAPNAQATIDAAVQATIAAGTSSTPTPAATEAQRTPVAQTPDEVLKQFYHNMNTKQYGQAYDLLSKSYRERIPRDDWITLWSASEPVEFEIFNVSTQNTTSHNKARVEGDRSTSFMRDGVAERDKRRAISELILEDGSWKIDDLD